MVPLLFDGRGQGFTFYFLPCLFFSFYLSFFLLPLSSEIGTNTSYNSTFLLKIEFHVHDIHSVILLTTYIHKIGNFIYKFCKLNTFGGFEILIYFNGMSTHLGLFDTLMFWNYVHCMLICTLLFGFVCFFNDI